MPGVRRRDTVRLPPWHCTPPYGSNMDPAQMLSRCPHSPQRGTGWLEGWRLTFGGEDIGWDGALATVVEEPGLPVFVRALSDMFGNDEKELDTTGTVVTLGLLPQGQGPGGDARRRRAGTGCTCSISTRAGLPSARSIGILADSAERAGAPGRLRFAALRALPCAKLGDSNAGYEGAEGAEGTGPRVDTRPGLSRLTARQAITARISAGMTTGSDGPAAPRAWSAARFRPRQAWFPRRLRLPAACPVPPAQTALGPGRGRAHHRVSGRSSPLRHRR